MQELQNIYQEIQKATSIKDLMKTHTKINRILVNFKTKPGTYPTTKTEREVIQLRKSCEQKWDTLKKA